MRDLSKSVYRHGILGRYPKFDSPQELLDLFLDYVDYCIENYRLPNIAGFRCYKFISKRTLFEYERKAEFLPVFDLIEDVLQDETINNKTIDAITKKLILQSKFGYVEKTENKNIEVAMTPEEAERIITEYESKNR